MMDELLTFKDFIYVAPVVVDAMFVVKCPCVVRDTILSYVDCGVAIVISDPIEDSS